MIDSSHALWQEFIYSTILAVSFKKFQNYKRFTEYRL